MTSASLDVQLAVAGTLTLDGNVFPFQGSASHETGWAVGLSIKLASPIDLHSLPLVGKVLPATGAFSLDDLQIFFPTPPQPAGAGATAGAQGIGVAGTLTLGGDVHPLSFILVPLTSSPSTGRLDAAPAPSPPSVSGAHWVSIQKSIGPFTIDRIGAAYAGGVLSLLFDGALTAAGLTLSLEGLAIGGKIHPFKPSFGLDGLGLDFSRGPVQIGGAFLRDTYSQDGQTVTEYDGLAVLRTESFCLAAIGSYAQGPDGHPSLFVYATLDYPLGGPAFFFVTGLAAGFGFHRNLLMPPITGVATFPLVAEAVSNGLAPPAPPSGGNPALLAEEIGKLHDFIPIDPTEDFLAVGVHFTTFKIIDSFALLAVKFGRHFEVMVLGLSTLVVPTPTPGAGPPAHALAVAQLALEAWFDPDAGVLAVQAQLTPESYVLSPDCHLTGGFAFYSWFSGEHAGDFVQTLGGYHPEFLVPSWYPTVPRLGFSWQLDSHISIKGYAYYALTAHALMAGGQLDAVFEAGPIKAWFIAGADFLICWKPYHYEARVYLDMGVSFTFWLFGTHHITVDLSVDLEIWGPSFSGKARVHLWIITFTISFGSGAREPQPIPWSEFTASFLPSAGDASASDVRASGATDDADGGAICSVAVAAGLVKTARGVTIDGGTHDVWVVNPKDFRLLTSTLIPCTKSPTVNRVAATPDPDDPTPDYGVDVAPMGGQIGLGSTHAVVVTPLDGSTVVLAQAPVIKRAPAALWGTSLEVDLNGQRFIDGAVMGCAITPGAEPTPGTTYRIPRANLRYDLFGFNAPSAPLPWTPIPAFDRKPVSPNDEQTLGASLVSDAGARIALLAGFGITAPDIAVDESVAGAFSVTPHLGQTAPAAEAA